MSVPETLVAGRYRLVSVIATGGMGVVWEAWDERLERAVAVKQLRTLPGVPAEEAEEAKDRAMREARITARLHHPHAVPVFDAVEHEGQPCLVMQLVPSTPLSALLRDSGPLPLGRVAGIGSEIASALAAAHTLGIIHRDVKPGNILITADGRAHISDFGISHAMGDATLTRTGMIHGTPAYLAPEVARGEDASFPADVFSLGSTLYAALEGSPPFGQEGNSIALLHKVAAAQVPTPTRAGPLTPFLLDMLSSDPGTRPGMDEVARVLGEATTAVAGGQPAREEQLAPTAVLHEPESQGLGALLGMEPQTGPEPRREAPVAVGDGPRGVDARGDAPPAPARPHRRRPPLALLVGLGVVVLALVLAFALPDNLFGDPDDGDRSSAASQTPSASSSASASEPAAQTPTASPTPSATPSPEPTPSSPEPEPTTASPSATASPSSTASPDRAARLSSAITSYYALLPDGTARAWQGMTADYQENHSGGRNSYEGFWGEIDDVAVSDVRATPPNRVEATLTYFRANGRVDIERTRFRLVEDGGRLKIAASEVLSSRRG